MEKQKRVYDVVIIGGGSAGCTIAARLSEDPDRQVLLLEAGPDPLPLPEIIASGAGGNRAILQSDYVVMYPTSREIDGSTYYPLAGRVMGGGSSVNMMGVVRPTQHDLDTWESLGNPGWSYEDMLPILRRIESDQDFGDAHHHGSDGPLTVKRSFSFDEPRSGPIEAFVDRAIRLGYEISPDLNVPDPKGIGPSAQNVKDGLRQSTAVAYLGPARERPNLHIIANATVVSLKIDGKRVNEVRYEHDGGVLSAAADTVVLSAGVYHSPQILQLSGIGPVTELEQLGIPVIHALEGVGGNYQDHAAVNMVFEGFAGFDPDWVISGFRLLFKSDSSLPNANFHLYMRAPVVVEGLPPLMPVAVNLIEQRARGRVHLTSTDPHDLPLITDAMLQHPDDVKAMTTAMQFIHDFVSTEAMAQYYGPLMQPGPGDDWAEYAQSTYDSYHHGVGTCAMGPASNPMAVVDANLRVHGLDNLYVADASVMPAVTHANTNVTVVMIAERLSDILKAANRR
jgi:choline dehydrogenase